MSVTVELAQEGEALDAVRNLCRQFRAWLYERYAAERDVIDLYYNPAAFEPLLDALPRLHARPGGAILLARQAGAPAGCVMLREQAPGVSEMKRMFVDPDRRGAGIGTALCRAALDRARADGFTTMRLDTGVRHDEAIPLYRRHGFVERDAYYDVPAPVAPILIFMERLL